MHPGVSHRLFRKTNIHLILAALTALVALLVATPGGSSPTTRKALGVLRR